MTEQTSNPDSQNSANWRLLEAKAAKADELESQLSKAQREIGFLRAGIDTTQGLGELIAKTYDGDPDPEQITEYAARYGYQQPATSQVTAEQQQRVDTLSRVEEVQRKSVPQGVAPLTEDEWRELRRSDPATAYAAWEAGRVPGRGPEVAAR